MGYSFVNWLGDVNIQSAIIGGIIGFLSSYGVAWWQIKQSNKQALKKCIEDIQEKATLHWCSSGSDRDNIPRSIHIENLITNLRRDLKGNKVVVSFIPEFNRAITGDSFSDNTRIACQHNDARIQLIRFQCTQLCEKLKI